mmetsp:Transcript_108617/g.350596  ORF Transcript_108617/g.350596 Transcript_108617/m.350596 type:complete len:312 (+) Transcript_108617:675-1610(+)
MPPESLIRFSLGRVSSSGSGGFFSSLLPLPRGIVPVPPTSIIRPLSSFLPLLVIAPSLPPLISSASPGTIAPPLAATALPALLLPAFISLSIPLSAAFSALTVFALRRPLLEQKVRQVHLATVLAMPHRALYLVLPDADFKAVLQVPENLVRILHVVLLKAQPQGSLVRSAGLVASFNDRNNTAGREAVVREVHLLDAGTRFHERGQGLCTLVIDVIFVELQDPKLLAACAHLQNLSQPVGRELVFREVYLLIRIKPVPQRKSLEVSICEKALRIVQSRAARRIVPVVSIISVATHGALQRRGGCHNQQKG